MLVDLFFYLTTPAEPETTMNTTQQPVAIVTGASSGMGLGITLALLEHGYGVVGTSRSISKSKELKASVDLVLIDGDISKKETAVKVAEAAIKHFGRIDLLVNNAGIFIPKPFTEYTEDDYNLVMNTNVASYFFMTQRVIPQMKKQNSGHIVNISAVLADQPSRQRACSSGGAFEVDHAGRKQGFGIGVRRQRHPCEHSVTGQREHPNARKRR